MTPQTAGWHDDPDDPAYLRYFDGVEWTSHREPKELPRPTTPDPYAASAQPGADPYASGGATAGGSAGGSAPWGPPSPGQQGGQQGGQAPWGPPSPGGYGGAHGAPQWQQAGPAQWQSAPPPPGGYPGWGEPSLHGRPLAGWWSRVGAFILDSLLVSAVLGALTAPLMKPTFDRMIDYFRETIRLAQAGAPASAAPDVPAPDARFYLAGVLAGLGYVLYDVVCTTRWGRTLGKRVCRIRVVDVERGGLLGWGPAAVRAAVKHVDKLAGAVPFVGGLASMFVLIDYLWPLWDKPLRQALHDKAAKSAVVRD